MSSSLFQRHESDMYHPMPALSPANFGCIWSHLLLLQMSYLTEELGLPEAHVQNIVVRSPKLLSYSVENMRDKQRYLEEGLKLGANDVSENDNITTDDGCEICRVLGVGSLRVQVPGIIM